MNKFFTDLDNLKWILAIVVPIITGIGGFFLKQFLYWKRNRVQTVTITEVQNTPLIQAGFGKELKVIDGGGKEYKNVQFFKLELINTTLSKDLENFDILFEFEKDAVVISDMVEKQSKLHEILKESTKSSNEIKYKIDLLNRNDKICFTFRVANTINNIVRIHFKVPSVFLNHRKPKYISPKIATQDASQSL